MKHHLVYIVAAFLAIAAAFCAYSVNDFMATQAEMTASIGMRDGKTKLMMDILDAETGQRGFLITGSKDYLDPYFSAITQIPKDIQDLQALKLNAQQRAFIDAIQPLINTKLDELRRTIDLRRTKGPSAAIAIVNTNEGKVEMDKLRKLFEADRAIALPQRDILRQKSTDSVSEIVYSFLGFMALLLVFTVLVSRKPEPPKPPEKTTTIDHLEAMKSAIENMRSFP